MMKVVKLKNYKNKYDDETYIEEEKSILEHYTELRLVVIKSLFFFIFMFILNMIAIRWTLPFFIKDYKLLMLGPLDVIKLYVSVSGILAVGLSIPFMGWQVWKFVSPALTRKERRLSLLFIPGMALFFILGLLFGYLIVYPIVYVFLLSLGEIHFDMMIAANEYFSFLKLTTLPFGFLFQLPIILMFLTSIDVVSASDLARARKYAYLALVTISVLVTPPDFATDVLMAAPLILLYELGLLLSKLIEKRKNKRKITQVK